ncbi:MAG: ribose 5-phosphate isomerase B [Chloroflexi bacterium]|nr:MAG: ribose 5-phosphate isomerase B [Chloroflexota bacterium]
MNDDAIRRAVERALRKHLGQAAGRTVIDAADIEAVPEGETLVVPPDAIITPLARQYALDRNITITQAEVALQEPQHRVIAIGADHGGYRLKEVLKAFLQADYNVIDCGTDSPDSVDYPDFAHAVAQQVSSGRAWRGIIIDGAGIGSCMAANKVPGVLAAMCYDQATAINSREHNNANVLTLGAGLIGEALAKQIVKTWLTTEFGGGRHARRVNKIIDIERRYRSE